MVFYWVANPIIIATFAALLFFTPPNGGAEQLIVTVATCLAVLSICLAAHIDDLVEEHAKYRKNDKVRTDAIQAARAKAQELLDVLN